MKRALIVLLALALLVLAVVGGAWLAPRMIEDPGYVLIEIAGWRIQMSLLVLVGAVLATWLTASLLVGVFRAPGRAIRRMRDAREQRSLDRGLMALSEGHWVEAERALKLGLRNRNSTAGYLAAARAAQGQGESRRRDAYLALADRRFGKRHFVTELTRARLLLSEDDASGAVELLERLHLKKPKHDGVLKLLLQAYQQTDRWHDVRLLVPAVRKAGLVDATRAEELMQLAAARELAAAPDPSVLQGTWRSLPSGLREPREVVAAFGARALELDRPELAGDELRRAIDAGIDAELLGLYAQADPADRPGRIRQCRNWLARDPDNAALHLALGRLYLDERDDERAREHLEIAARRSPDAAAYAALGRVLDRSGNLEAATRCYRNALRLEQGRAPEPLPPPTQSAESDASR